MTSRVIDIAASYISKNERLIQRYGSTLWTNVLKTVGGFQMYRQYVQPQVSGSRVIDFLTNDVAFPRAIRCCVENSMRSAGALPNSAATVKQLTVLQDTLMRDSIGELDAPSVSRMMDTLQMQLGRVHRAVAATWFLAGPA
jgi:uncharacterized alpha-E superfamily protein